MHSSHLKGLLATAAIAQDVGDRGLLIFDGTFQRSAPSFVASIDFGPVAEKKKNGVTAAFLGGYVKRGFTGISPGIDFGVLFKEDHHDSRAAISGSNMQRSPASVIVQIKVTLVCG